MLVLSLRDLKPENILFADKNEGSDIKLADFGLSGILPQPSGSRNFAAPKALLHDPVGTAYYVAPEVVTSPGKGYGPECDIWSLGVILYIALGGYPPFNGDNEEKVLHSVVHGPLLFDDPSWDEVSHGAKDIISKMLCKKPEKRASIAELLEHPWLSTDVDFYDSQNGDPQNGEGREKRVTCSGTGMPESVVLRLKQFAAMNNFKKEARRMLAMFLPEEEVG